MMRPDHVPTSRPTLTLETNRLLLRDIQEEDWPAIVEYHRDPEVRRYLLPGQGTKADVRRWVHDAVLSTKSEPRGSYALAVVLKERYEIIGTCMLQKATTGSRNARIGFDLDRRHWNHGYTTEAMKRLVAFGFQECGVARVFADCFAANGASIRVMEKLGMERYGRSRFYPWVLAFAYGVNRPIARYTLPAWRWSESSPVA